MNHCATGWWGFGCWQQIAKVNLGSRSGKPSTPEDQEEEARKRMLWQKRGNSLLHTAQWKIIYENQLPVVTFINFPSKCRWNLIWKFNVKDSIGIEISWHSLTSLSIDLQICRTKSKSLSSPGTINSGLAVSGPYLMYFYTINSTKTICMSESI